MNKVHFAEMRMRMKIKNVVEEVVIGVYEEVKGDLKCCTCKQCSSDIVAYVLNKVSPRYVSTEKGALYSKTTVAFDKAYRMEIVKIIAEAARVVGENPKH